MSTCLPVNPTPEPYNEPYQRSQCYASAQRIGHDRIEPERLFRDKKERTAHRSHKECGDKRNQIGFVFTDEIGRKSPQRDNGKCLVGPAEVLPNNIKAVGVLHLPQKEQYRSYKHRHTDSQPAANGLLLNV